jgi:hypothetical protein
VVLKERKPRRKPYGRDVSHLTRATGGCSGSGSAQVPAFAGRTTCLRGHLARGSWVRSLPGVLSSGTARVFA